MWPTTGSPTSDLTTLLEIFKFLPIAAALKAREVNSQWQALIVACDMPPARRDLFNLYLDCVKSRAFIESRPWVQANLKPFDRQAYIDAVYEQYCDSEGTIVEPVIPELFLIWILEWPALAVIPNFWPGLPFPFEVKEGMKGVSGCNHLARIPPVLSRFEYMPDATSDADDFFAGPSLMVYCEDRGHEIWLSLDERWKGKTVWSVRETDDAFDQ
ncbi:hypothetical protein D9758_004190 [Tetrapyrgos nigripes]|uniref:F-box domain-containing protein n=1 Tax=Tetrapyrgos nigripes TaxID=182062 RepID=A0A8H5LVN1_9AGAR|nr:hypothetical protein D9758_004190 [Tetrapyrgos nigripes]